MSSHDTALSVLPALKTSASLASVLKREGYLAGPGTIQLRLYSHKFLDGL